MLSLGRAHLLWPALKLVPRFACTVFAIVKAIQHSAYTIHDNIAIAMYSGFKVIEGGPSDNLEALRPTGQCLDICYPDVLTLICTWLAPSLLEASSGLPKQVQAH